MSAEAAEEALLTVEDVARALNVSDKTIRRWIRSGHVKYVLVGPAKRIRITRSEMLRMSGVKKEQ